MYIVCSRACFALLILLRRDDWRRCPVDSPAGLFSNWCEVSTCYEKVEWEDDSIDLDAENAETLSTTLHQISGLSCRRPGAHCGSGAPYQALGRRWRRRGGSPGVHPGFGAQVLGIVKRGVLEVVGLQSRQTCFRLRNSLMLNWASMGLWVSLAVGRLSLGLAPSL